MALERADKNYYMVTLLTKKNDFLIKKKYNEKGFDKKILKTPYKTFSISQFKYFLISVQLRQLLKSLRFASSFFWWFNFFPQPPAAKVIAKKPKLGEND